MPTVIRTLEDLHAYFQLKDAADDEPGDEIRLRKPGLSAAEIARLRELLPELPDDYLEILSRYDVEGLNIQFHSLSPFHNAFKRGVLVERLVEANQEPSWCSDILKQHRLLEVGSVDGDPLCIASRDAALPGEVFLLDHEWVRLVRFASRFEDLLIGLGRLDEQQQVTGPHGPAGVQLFLASIRDDLDLDDEQMKEWTSLAEMTLELHDIDE
jgi:hypothetical protein